jgi:hypothetical protein
MEVQGCAVGSLLLLLLRLLALLWYRRLLLLLLAAAHRLYDLRVGCHQAAAAAAVSQLRR